MTAPINNALQAMLDQFADQLPARLTVIRTQFQKIDYGAVNQDELSVLHRLVHSLTGAAGTFGMASISNAARRVETLLSALLSSSASAPPAAWTEVAVALENLDALARARLSKNAPSLNTQEEPNRPLDRTPLVFLVEDDTEQANYLSETLAAADFRVKVFSRIDEFRTANQNRDAATGYEQPAAVVMDMMLEEGDTAGAQLVDELKLGERQGIPVVFVSARNDLAARLIAFRAGASRYLSKPVYSIQLCRLMDEVTGRMPPNPYRVLLVDDDQQLLEVYSLILRQAGMAALAVSQPLRALEELEKFKPDVLILDMYMPDATGPELAAVLREQDKYAQMPILFLSAEVELDKQLLALNLGGDDFLVKPIAPQHLVAAVTARARRARQNEETTQRLQLALYEREREHLALDLHALVSITDRAGQITYANNAFCTVSGYSLDELLGQNHRLLKSSAHPPEFYSAMWATLGNGNIWRGEVCNKHKNGGLYWGSTTITPFLDRAGKVYQYVAISTDITNLKATQENLLLSQKRLQDAQALSHLGHWTANTVTGALEWSDEVYRIFGRDPAAFKPSIESFHAAIHPDDLEWVTKLQQLSIQTGVYDATHRIIRPDGELRFVHELARPERNASDQLILAGTSQDITERKLIEIALEESRQIAIRANQAKSEFLSSISHELRTPMNAILGFGQMLESDSDLNADQKDSVQEILTAGQHLLDLINEVLDLARIEAGRVDLIVEPVRLSELAEECEPLIKSMAAARGIKLNVAVPEDAVVSADRMRLKQVLVNLLSNAVKYNADAGDVALAVEPSASAGQLRISVTDTGVGIAEEFRSALFEPFSRLDKQHSGIEGTGIGLTITRKLVNLMGGEVGVIHLTDGGSTFWIELPCADSSTFAESNDSDAEMTPAEITAVARSYRVLCIDDNPTNLRLIRRMLATRKYIQPTITHSPRLGIDLALADRPDLILMDISMPEMDGYQVLEAIRAHDQLKIIPVIALTTNAMVSDIERGKAVGFNDYLTKPLDLRHFLNTVDSHLLGKPQ